MPSLDQFNPSQAQGPIHSLRICFGTCQGMWKLVLKVSESSREKPAISPALPGHAGIHLTDGVIWWETSCLLVHPPVYGRSFELSMDFPLRPYSHRVVQKPTFVVTLKIFINTISILKHIRVSIKPSSHVCSHIKHIWLYKHLSTKWSEMLPCKRVLDQPLKVKLPTWSTPAFVEDKEKR